MSYWRDKGVQFARALEARPKDWSPSEVAMVRRMASAGASTTEVCTAFDGRFKPATIRQRAAKLGIRFHLGKRPYGVETTLPKSERGVDCRFYRPATLEGK